MSGHREHAGSPSGPPGHGRIAVRVKPGSSRAAVGGRHDGPYGPAVVVAVHARAVDGKATEAAVRGVAQALGVPAADLAVRLGERSRDKLLELANPPADLTERVARLLAGAP